MADKPKRGLARVDPTDRMAFQWTRYDLLAAVLIDPDYRQRPGQRRRAGDHFDTFAGQCSLSNKLEVQHMRSTVPHESLLTEAQCRLLRLAIDDKDAAKLRGGEE